jgi:hypothetical protein
VAAQIVGIDLPPNVTYEMLDVMKKESVEQESQRRQASLMDRQPGEPAEEKDPAQQYEEKSITEPAPVRFAPSFKQMAEMQLWHDIARRKLKRGEPLEFEFTSSLPDDIHGIIGAKVAQSITYEQLEQAFDLTGSQPEEYKTSEILQLVNALNHAVEIIQ